LTFAIPGSEPLIAVAAMNDRLFVTRQPKTSNQIEVYNATTFKLLRYITITEANSWLCGLAVIPTYKYLFVSDFGNGVVHKVDLSSISNNNNPTITRLTVCNEPNGLSFNVAKNLLVSCIWGAVQEYTTSGSLVRSVTLGRNLWHTIELNNGMWAVSRYGDPSQVNQVYLMSTGGTILSTYGTAAAGSGPGQLNQPQSLVADRNGYIAVADRINNRILVLNPTLSQARKFWLPLQNTGVIKQPRDLCFDESRGRLYVTEVDGQKRVLVFDNVFNLNEASTP
jgi:sugar lactone lactonase YvrE